MGEDLFFHELLLLGLLWLCLIWYGVWSRSRSIACQAPHKAAKPPTQGSTAKKPFPGLTHKPLCVACEEAEEPCNQVPPARPALIISTRGCPRQVDTQHQFCPNPRCRYYGWVGWGNLRANGHPSGGRWRQWYCVRCQSYFLETQGTLFHGKKVPAELLVRVVASLAEGLGIRAVARVFEVDPNTVLAWLVEAADQLTAYSRHFLHDVQVSQVQLDELFALL